MSSSPTWAILPGSVNFAIAAPVTYFASIESEIGASTVTRFPTTAVTVRSHSWTVPGAIHVSPASSRTRPSIPMKATHALVTGR